MSFLHICMNTAEEMEPERTVVFSVVVLSLHRETQQIQISQFSSVFHFNFNISCKRKRSREIPLDVRDSLRQTV